jgi:hypothetical protein
MNNIYDFIKVKGTYESRYFGKEETHLQRYFTFKTAISLFLQRGLKNIVETGCQRNLVDWGAGNSSLIFSETLADFPDKGKLYSVDISQKNLMVCYEVTKKFNNTILYSGDSVEFLKQFNEEIGLLYLDSLDYEANLQQESQEHQLKEIKAIYPRLNDKTIVMLDDNDFPNGGKTKLTKEFLQKEGWIVVLDHQQSLWIRG